MFENFHLCVNVCTNLLKRFFDLHEKECKSVGNRLRHHIFGRLKIKHLGETIHIKVSRFKSVKKLSGRNCTILKKVGFFLCKS